MHKIFKQLLNGTDCSANQQAGDVYLSFSNNYLNDL